MPASDVAIPCRDLVGAVGGCSQVEILEGSFVPLALSLSVVGAFVSWAAGSEALVGIDCASTASHSCSEGCFPLPRQCWIDSWDFERRFGPVASASYSSTGSDCLGLRTSE